MTSRLTMKILTMICPFMVRVKDVTRCLSYLSLSCGIIFSAQGGTRDYDVFPTPGADTDEDGLNDDWEQNLINFYRPKFVYSEDENYWPCSLWYFVANSTLVYKTLSNPVVANRYLDPREGGHPLQLFAHSTDAPPGIYANVTQTDDETEYFLNLNDGARFANDGNWSRSPYRGIYAQCQMITSTFDAPGTGGRVEARPEAPLIHITYYQFFAFNDYDNPHPLVPAGRADHEGDWLFLHVFVAPSVTIVSETRPDAGTFRQQALRALVYFHHGSSAPCTPTLLDGKDDLKNYTDGGIPVAYLERGSHEWYPAITGFGATPGLGCSGGVLDGDGQQYRIASPVVNLGQRYAPMFRPGEDELTAVDRVLALFFNGRWGQPPECDPIIPCYVSEPGPKGLALNEYLQREHPWLVVYANSNTVKGPGREGAGSRYFPYVYVGEAAVNVRPGGVIYLPPGEHLGSRGHEDLVLANCTITRDPATNPGPIVIRP